MRSNYMKDAYEAKIVPLGKHGNFIAMEKEEGKTTKECLWNLAQEHKSDMIVVGNHGRKGPKKEETVCGSAIEYLSLNSFNPILIIKDFRPRTVKPDGCLRWGVCYDGSTRSKKALEHVLNTMRRTDKLAVITVRESVNQTEAHMKRLVDESCTQFGITKYEVTFLD